MSGPQPGFLGVMTENGPTQKAQQRRSGRPRTEAILEKPTTLCWHRRRAPAARTTRDHTRRSGSKSSSGRWSHWNEIGWVHYPEIGWSHSDEIRRVQSHEILQAHGFLYLMAILDIASRKVLAWRVSNTMSADFCVEALEEALRKFGPPEIFNTDQGSQFTSEEWIAPLKAAGVAISMDGKGRWIDNVFIERLWRSVKYEDVYLRAYGCGSEARQSLTRYFAFYNARRVHENLGYATPDEMYFAAQSHMCAAA
jgi:transposase InsO family protein